MRTLNQTLLSLCLLLLAFHFYGSDGLRLHGEPFPSRMAARISFERQGRIANGDLAAIGEWPWIVSVQNQFGFDFCGGVIIDDLWILTAASCVSGLRPGNLLILSGTVSSWNNTAAGHFVKQIHVHCNFDKPLYYNDIALLRLTESIQFNAETAKIPLSEIDQLEEGEKLSFAGWGTTGQDGAKSQYLQQSAGNYVPVKKCRSALGDTEDVDLGHVCVQMENGKGACHGDTGGPLINAKGQLVGVGNWGVPCGRGFPDVYARVSFYNDWIRSVINGCGIA